MEKSENKSMTMDSFLVVILAMLLFLGSENCAFAYIDPGTGSYMFQVSIALVIGGMFFFKNLLRSIISTIKSAFGKVIKVIGNGKTR